MTSRKSQVQNLTEELASVRADLACRYSERDDFYRQLCETRRLLTQARHQRDMARLALSDAHRCLSFFRSQAVQSGNIATQHFEKVIAICDRGLTLSAQADQPEAGR